MAKAPNARLAQFLIRLAVSDEWRDRFDADPEGTLEGLNPPLSSEVKNAILKNKQAFLRDELTINNQVQLILKKGQKPSLRKGSKKR